MTQQERSLNELIQGLPRTIAGQAVPSLSHCVGTDKLLGSFLGRAITEESGVVDEDVTRALTSLCCLLRAYIVIDDFWRDNGVSILEYPQVPQVLDRIGSACTELMSLFSPSAELLWASGVADYDAAFHNFRTSRLYESVTSKCALIFLPFKLAPVSSSGRAAGFLDLMQRYLFCLQLLDDFHHIEEYYMSPVNHNIFASGLSTSAARRLASRRVLFARPLLRYVSEEIFVLKDQVRGATARRSLDNSIEWLSVTRSAMQGLPSFFSYRCNIRKFDPCVRDILNCEFDLNDIDNSHFANVRAESMHTLIEASE